MTTSTAQRAELQSRIWKIADEVRGAVDGWDFKQYVLGCLFYRFISENFADYMQGGDPDVCYQAYLDDDLNKEIIDLAVKERGYFIYPSQLFVNVVKNANNNKALNTDLQKIFNAIIASAKGKPSEEAIAGLFTDFDTTSSRLGNTVEDKNKRLKAVLQGIADLSFDDFSNSKIDLFGDAYEFLISNYADNAGKSGGEFFTPPEVSKLLANLAVHGQESINKVYDPACGSGSLLLQVKKLTDKNNIHIDEGFFGQEINHTTYNLARMNMFLHNINYYDFKIHLGDTLLHPEFKEQRPFDVIVSNPPYSIKWIGSDDTTLINDYRFAPASVLAPKSKADFAFIMHSLYYLSAKGRAALVCFPGIMYRGGAEQKIRQYLIDNNFVETVISLAPNLFYGTSIAVNILVLSKHKNDCKVQFIDASSADFFAKATNNNVLKDEYILKMVDIFTSKQEIEHISKIMDILDIAKNDYNLSISAYVEPKDTREIIDIKTLNQEITNTVEKITHFRSQLDAIIADLEA